MNARPLKPVDQASFRLAKKWFADCKANHRDCPHGDTPLPTRIIDVGLPTTNSLDFRLRIVETDGQKSDYVAKLLLGRKASVCFDPSNSQTKIGTYRVGRFASEHLQRGFAYAVLRYSISMG